MNNTSTYTEPTKTLYNRVKPKLAIFVPTIALSFILCACTAPQTAYAQDDTTRFAKLCFTLSNSVYDIVQKPEAKAVAQKDYLVSTFDNKGLSEAYEDLFYLAQAKKEIYKNQNLKAYLQLHCTGIVRKAMDKGYAAYLAE